MHVQFGREICGRLEECSRREWLVTNGIGGYAAGTVAGALTRRYHGILVAALEPPLGRTLLVSKIDETVGYDGVEYPLFTNYWSSGAAEPHGYRFIERFHLDGSVAVWTYSVGDALLEKRVWMQHGSNTTCIRYKLLRGGKAVCLRLRALVNYRDYHSATKAGDWRFQIGPTRRGIRIEAFRDARPFYLLSDFHGFSPAHEWHFGFELPLERYRGLPDREDHLHAASLEAELGFGQALTVFASTEECAGLDAGCSLGAEISRSKAILSRFRSVAPPGPPSWVERLVLAADQFIVDRPLPDDPDGKSVIAGYPWFGDWGRDTMISLPGLTLTTGRPEIAKKILGTFSRFVDRGMLPNRFPDQGQQPEYNTADATLWYFEAVRMYYQATKDRAFVEQIFPLLEEVIDWHIRGTRYGIRVDQNDWLLYAGEPGVQLTWMDAKVGDWVVTPRTGKPVELNALWLNALGVVAALERELMRAGNGYSSKAANVRSSFRRFWNAGKGYCFDVIDGPGGRESALRPNQILAVSLPVSALDEAQQKAVVDVCARQLLTSFGLRSLAPGSPHYAGRYAGGPVERDAAYHQGSVWSWLIGPFVLAHLRVYQDPELAMTFLEPFANHLLDTGLGTISEIFDADAPFESRGCFAQAWSVAEVLRAWAAIRGREHGVSDSAKTASVVYQTG